MTVSRIEEVTVYTSSTQDAMNTHQLHAWFDHSNIAHTKLDYKDSAQIQSVLDAVNTWWHPDDQGITQPPILQFPFVIYTEVHSDKSVSYLPRKYIQGTDNIIAQLPTLYSLGR